MIRVEGTFKGESDFEYTAYYFLDGDKAVYVLAWPLDASGKKSVEPQFDEVVDDFVQHITTR